MKKQFLIFATITAIVFTSCSKEKIGTPTSQANQVEEIAGARNPGGNVASPTLTTGLLARFQFNGNLKDSTGRIADGTFLIDGLPAVGKATYTTDRKGMRNSAIRFNEDYGVIFYDVPLDTNMSVSVWVQYDMLPEYYRIAFVEGSQSFALSQLENNFMGGYWNPIAGQYVNSKPMNKNWHHLAATRDNNSLKFYIDGNLVGSSATPVGSGGTLTASEYIIGCSYNAGYKYWRGSMDELRVYKRVISGTEVKALFNQ